MKISPYIRCKSLFILACKINYHLVINMETTHGTKSSRQTSNCC
ncbi:hypothetical protein [Moraxella lacunata]